MSFENNELLPGKRIEFFYSPSAGAPDRARRRMHPGKPYSGIICKATPSLTIDVNIDGQGLEKDFEVKYLIKPTLIQLERR